MLHGEIRNFDIASTRNFVRTAKRGGFRDNAGGANAAMLQLTVVCLRETLLCEDQNVVEFRDRSTYNTICWLFSSETAVQFVNLIMNS